MARVKLCGMTRPEDAELAADLGAWAIGFNLWPGSKRLADPAVAAGIARALRRRVELVGVFVNPTLDEVVHAAEGMGLTHVQLHGDEGPAFCTAVAERTGARVIKAVGVASGADIRAVERFHTDFHMLDAPAGKAFGGTGRTWDWGLAAQRRSQVPVILAGGLDPGNVADAIAAVRPWAVDVASGIESAPGVKDPAKMEAFMAAVAGVGAAT
jgi:phosphoribosylanthranilate isomerase